MCPPKTCGIDEIGDFVTEEKLIVYLESIQNRSPEASLPRNVVADINPYLHKPADLSDVIWYVVHSEDPKLTEVGFWKAKGDPCQIYSDSSIVGWRTTLEFYEGYFPIGNQTDWLMQEYAISHKGSENEKGASSLCRVFLSDREGETHKMDQHQANDGALGQNNPIQDEHNKSEMPIKSKLQENEMGRHQAIPAHQGNNRLQGDCIAKGDYLELLDLLDPMSSPSSSDSSSCVSCPSDLYFDSAALLQELEHEDEVCQTKPSTDKFSISKPNEMIVSPPAEGSPISGNNKPKEPGIVEGSAPILTLKRKLHDKDHIPPENTRKRPPPVSDDVGSSSSSQKPDKGKKIARGKMLKKFFCFIAF